MNWEFRYALVYSFVIALSFYHANAKSVAEKLNAVNTKSKKQVPYSIAPNPFPGIYGGFSTFANGGQYKRQKVGGWWGRRDTIGGDEDLGEYKRQKVPGWWGRRDSIGGKENLHVNSDDKRQDPGKWWGRRDIISGDEDSFRYGKEKRQKVGGWWGRRDTIDGEENLHGDGEDKRQDPGKWWGRRDTIDIYRV